ncbi:MAG: CusA/CzcA family heavy metal efflux RND transporter [Candidatus Obscuribacterales bacterium]|nr:CusA/CzcA family heavy metal efflux RND transporter [Candidatus Obscuribacterales bacterium]
MNNLIYWSLRKKWLVAVFAIVITVYGILVAMDLPVDVFPDFAPTQVVVQTEAPGFAPEEVESLITLPLETVLNGTPNVRLVRSISTTGLSVVTLLFEDGTNVFIARQLVSERIQGIRNQLPSDVDQPFLMPITTAVGDILKIGIIAKDKTSLMDIRTMADWTIRRRIMSVPGVANVVVYGGEEKQYQVLVDPRSLKEYGLTLEQVIEAARGSNRNAPGGYLRTPDQEFLIRGLGRVKNIEDLEKTVITSRNGLPVLLSHVATIQIGPGFKTGDAIVNGSPGVLLSVTKQPWANTLLTTRKVEEALASLKTSMPADLSMVYTFRQADFIETAIKNMLEALFFGALLVIAVLFVFLQNWRTAAISLTAIPLSLLTAIIALKLQGGTINTMTLGGLAIAVGEVVDDAIIDVENVYRRLKENKLSDHSKPAFNVVFDASREIRGSVVYATFIVALVFLPIFSLSGLEGKIFAPLGFSYIVAIVASLMVALTVTPAMCLMLLGQEKELPDQEPFLLKLIKSTYQPLLSFSLKYPRSVLIAATFLFLISLLPLAIIGREFLPAFDESNLIVATNSVPGTSLELTTKTGQSITTHLCTHKSVLAAGQRAGRAKGSDDYGGSNFCEYDIRLRTGDSNPDSLIDHLRKDIADVPGLVVNIGSYISHRMDHVLSGVNAAIAIKIFGPDLNVLHRTASQVEKVAAGIPGAVDVQIEPIIPIPEIGIKIDRSKAARYGLNISHLTTTIEAAFNGLIVSQIVEQQRTFDLVVRFQPQFKADIDSLSTILIDTPSGARVPLNTVAVIEIGTSPNTIRHENVSRYVVVQANVSEADLGGVIDKLRSQISQQIHLPAGYYIIYGGQFEAQEKATQQLVLLSVLAIVGIFLLLLMAFGNAKAAALVLLNLPLALIGGIWAIVLTGGLLSVGSLLGFITLFGISTRNGIMLVMHFRHLLLEGLSFEESLRTGALDRLSPVLMTALTAALGLLPIAILGGSGRELEQPLAIVILGGMLSSTALTLIVMPALFQCFGRAALGASPAMPGKPVQTQDVSSIINQTKE